MRREMILRRLGAAALGMAVFALPALCGLARADGQAPAAGNATNQTQTVQNNATAQDNATDFTKWKVNVVVRLYDGVFSGPMPYWVHNIREMQNLNKYREQRGNIFVMRFIPKSQDFSSWTRLYGVYGFELPRTNMERFVGMTKNSLLEDCKQGGEIKTLGTSKDAVVLELSCPELNPSASINNGMSVEHGYLYIAHTGDTYVQVHQSWRGTSANATESPDWATNPEIRKQVLDGIRTMKFTPAE